MEQERPPCSVTWLLIAFLLLALCLRVAVAIHSPSIEYPDEIFETLEPGHHLAFGFGVVTWEWIQGARSWVFPALLAGVMRLTEWMGPGSSGYVAAIKVLLSLISLTAVWFGFAWCRRASGRKAAILAAGANAISVPLIYFAPKAFNEVVAGNLLLPGLYLGMYSGRSQSRRQMFLAGLFCGVAFALRIQLAPAIVFAVLYFCWLHGRKAAAVLLAGFVVPIMAFGVVDAFTWSYPFQSFVRYFWMNTAGSVSSSYGKLPWYTYARTMVNYVGPLLLLALAGVRKSPLLGWMVLIIVACHSAIPHKEARFLYPVIPLCLTLAGLGAVEIATFLGRHSKLCLSPKAVVAVGLSFFAVCSAVAAWRFNHWRQAAGGLVAFDVLSREPSVCGIGLYKLSWAWTGGYTYLHRNVPIILVLHESEMRLESHGFNALVMEGRAQEDTMPFYLQDCWNGVCLYRRPGSCIASPQYREVNKMLRSGYQ